MTNYEKVSIDIKIIKFKFLRNIVYSIYLIAVKFKSPTLE